MVDLDSPPEGHTYQAWQIVDGAPVSVGVLDTHAGQVAFTADLAAASAIALSVEPLGGSQTPTTTPILVTELPKS
jgi:anti-sigma-K factor RskA